MIKGLNKRLKAMVMLGAVVCGLGATSMSSNVFADDTKFEEKGTNAIQQEMYSENTRASWNINWPMAAKENAYGTSSFSGGSSLKFSYNIKWSSKPGTMRVGLYNKSTGKYDWKKSSDSSLVGIMSPSANGVHSFALGNTTDTAVTMTGSYSLN
ncbi:MAG: hypothetical protein ACRC3Y_07955, partial [Romboutsia sp.]|uniref:hypothetical protein n=1 Tax=Romboutsia sp. TaxID=1965302 RepID=UPI003F2DDB1D